MNRLSRVHERYRRQTTDRQTTDGPAIAYSEREREFTFANNNRLTVNLLLSDISMKEFLKSVKI